MNRKITLSIFGMENEYQRGTFVHKAHWVLTRMFKSILKNKTKALPSNPPSFGCFFCDIKDFNWIRILQG